MHAGLELFNFTKGVRQHVYLALVERVKLWTTLRNDCVSHSEAREVKIMRGAALRRRDSRSPIERNVCVTRVTIRIYEVPWDGREKETEWRTRYFYERLQVLLIDSSVVLEFALSLFVSKETVVRPGKSKKSKDKSKRLLSFIRALVFTTRFVCSESRKRLWRISLDYHEIVNFTILLRNKTCFRAKIEITKVRKTWERIKHEMMNRLKYFFSYTI